MDYEENESQISESQLSNLLRKTGPRDIPSQEITEEIRANVKSAWQQEVDRNARAGRRRYAIAAGFALVICTGALISLLAKPDVYATVSKVVNQVEYQRRDGSWFPLAGAEITEEINIRTGVESYASIHMKNGLNLRIADNSQVELLSIDELAASEGIVYIDTANEGISENTITVVTPYGQVRDIGTQFQVNVTPIDWQIQVREGSVEIEAGAENYFAAENEKIVIDRDDSSQTTEIRKDDASWEWTQEVSTSFQLEGERLNAYLNWVGRESGKAISYRSEIARMSAQLTILHGSIEGLKPTESLTGVLATTDFFIVSSDSDSIVIDK